MEERAFRAPAVTINNVYKNGSVSEIYRRLSRFVLYGEFASKLYNLTRKYFEEVQRCTDKNTMYGKTAQNKQKKDRIC